MLGVAYCWQIGQVRFDGEKQYMAATNNSVLYR